MVRRARVTAGLTREELAEKGGIDRSYIGGVERGEQNPTFFVKCKTAGGLHLPVPDLVSDEKMRRGGG
ncbi:helix-turn-helix domain-containing protein [Rubritepida flocculans]|uniref:helix-turn-helix domain-containing protein n=1 Tax=Rubritepida flocculans TaxID=182403 RepID=UPI0038CD848E